MRDAILEISSKRLGATAVVEKKKIAGIITDGDIRRMLEKNMDIAKTKAAQVMGKSPRTIEADALAVEAFQVMEAHNITTLIVTKNGEYKGIVHLHDILKEGIFWKHHPPIWSKYFYLFQNHIARRKKRINTIKKVFDGDGEM